MPGGDRTGPMGMGPMTGRGAGYCAGFAVPGFVNRPFGGFFGRPFGGFFGRGRGAGGGGRGWRNMYYATGLPGWARMGVPAADGVMPTGAFGTVSPQQELDMLKQQAQEAANVLERIHQRIGELEGGATE